MGDAQSDRVFERAAELFGLLFTSTQLQIQAGQHNDSQHTRTQYRAGVLPCGLAVHCRIGSPRVSMLCDAPSWAHGPVDRAKVLKE